MSDEYGDDTRPPETLVDPRRPTFHTFVGKKYSGKSHLAARFWETWPYDRIAIDPNGDAAVGDDVQRLEAPLPVTWPLAQERVSLHFVPDPGSATYRDDLDRALGLAMSTRRPVLAWLDEVGEHTRANATGPNMRRALHQGRHRGLSLLMCGPRPIDVDPLVMAQADHVYVFDLPNPADRKRVANVIGYDPGDLDDAVRGLGSHEYLRFDGHELVHFPALPPRKIEIPRTERLDPAGMAPDGGA